MGLILLRAAATLFLYMLDYGFYISTDLRYWNTQYARETIPAWLIFIVMNIALLSAIWIH